MERWTSSYRTRKLLDEFALSTWIQEIAADQQRIKEEPLSLISADGHETYATFNQSLDTGHGEGRNTNQDTDFTIQLGGNETYHQSSGEDCETSAGPSKRIKKNKMTDQGLRGSIFKKDYPDMLCDKSQEEPTLEQLAEEHHQESIEAALDIAQDTG